MMAQHDERVLNAESHCVLRKEINAHSILQVIPKDVRQVCYDGLVVRLMYFSMVVLDTP